MRFPLLIYTILLPGQAFTASGGSDGALLSSHSGGSGDSLTGKWTGTSICQTRNSSCRDENVVFYISPAGGESYKIRADKIVNGQAIDMGELDFVFDQAAHTLTCKFSAGTWVLVVGNRHIEGSLTTPEKVLFKRLSLSKTG